MTSTVVDVFELDLDKIPLNPYPDPCARCGAQMFKRRANVPFAGRLIHFGNGLCSRCYGKEHKAADPSSPASGGPKPKKSGEIVHGTYRAYLWHRRHRNRPCPPCIRANNDYKADLNERERIARHGVVEVPLDVLGLLLLAAPTALEEWVEEQLGATPVEMAISAAESEGGADRG